MVLKEETVVCHSTSEVEYRSLANVFAELTWFQMMFSEIGINISGTPTIYVTTLVLCH